MQPFDPAGLGALGLLFWTYSVGWLSEDSSLIAFQLVLAVHHSRTCSSIFGKASKIEIAKLCLLPTGYMSATMPVAWKWRSMQSATTPELLMTVAKQLNG